MKNRTLLNGIITVMFFSVAAKGLSFFIELITAYRFGATLETDVYYLVYGITQIITPMFTVGIWKVYMPAYKERQVLGQNREAKKLTDQLVFLFTLCCGLLIVLGCVFPKFIISVFAPGFKSETLELAQNLLRILLPLLLFVIMSVFYSAILQANNQFVKSQSKYLLQHIPTLLYLLFGTRILSIRGLSVSLVLGEVCAFILVVLFSRRMYRFSYPQEGISEDTKKVLKLVPAACLNSVINQINHIVDKAFGSMLQTGALTYMNHGSKLISLFDGIVSTAFSTAFFPRLVELRAKDDIRVFKRFVDQYILILLSVLVPVTVIVLFYSETIVSIVFGHGEFGSESVTQTSVVLFMYGLGLIAMGINTVFNDIFYITKKTYALFVTNCINIVVNVILNVVLVKLYGIVGLSLATSLSLYILIFIKALWMKEYLTIDRTAVKSYLHLMIGCFAGIVSLLFLIHVFSFGEVGNLLIGALVFAGVYGIIVFHPGSDCWKVLGEVFGKKVGD